MSIKQHLTEVDQDHFYDYKQYKTISIFSILETHFALQTGIYNTLPNKPGFICY